MTDQRNGYYRPDAGITDIAGSVWNLASAGTQFAIDQVQNAMSMFTDPSGAMNRVKASIDNLSDAMVKPYAAEASTPDAPIEVDTGLNGRKA